MKVYLVEMNEGQYDEHCVWTEKVFSSYQKATEFLFNNKFTPYSYYLTFQEPELYWIRD
jgi:hypothetical protein